MSSAGLPEILIQLLSLLPIMAFGIFIYLIVRLAIRHERRNQDDR